MNNTIPTFSNIRKNTVEDVNRTAVKGLRRPVATVATLAYSALTARQNPSGNPRSGQKYK